MVSRLRATLRGPRKRHGGACLWLQGIRLAVIAAGTFVPVPDAAALWDDRLELFIAESISHDDNVFRLSSARDPATVLGSSSKGDTYHTTSLGLNLNVPVGRQRFVGGLAWIDTRYNRFTVLDFTGHEGRATWLWQIGDDLSGKLGYTEILALESLANVQSGGGQSLTPNALTTRQAYVNAGYQLTPRWELRGEVNRLERSNELSVRQVNDVIIDGADLTVSYVTPAKNKLGFSVRAEEASYPNPQTVSGLSIDNAYRQHIIAAVTDWTLTGHSHVTARAGRVSRYYEQLPQRDFEGPTYQAVYDWKPTAGFMLTALAQREISTTEEVTVGYVLVKGAALRPTLKLTEKVSLSGFYEYKEREYRGDPRLLLGTVSVRIDHVRTAAAAVSYRPIRRVTLEVAYRRETRSSTVPFGDYEVNVVRVSAAVGF